MRRLAALLGTTLLLASCATGQTIAVHQGTDLLDGQRLDYYYSLFVNPAFYSGPRASDFYVRTVVPGNSNWRGVTVELQAAGTGGVIPLTSASYFTGSGISLGHRSGQGLTINQGPGTNDFSEGLLGLSSVTGTGTDNRSYGVRGRVINSGTGTTKDAAALVGELVLTNGVTPKARGIKFEKWQRGGEVDTSDVIYADATTAPGIAAHFINSQCPAPSLFAGDIGITDPGSGFLLTSPNGRRWRMSVSDAGMVSVLPGN